MAKMSFRDKVVIITGASSGIGRELAHQLASQGNWLTLAARRLALLEDAAAECQELGGRAVAVQTDVSRTEDCETCVRQTIETYGRIDALVNNAGITMWANFDQITDFEPMEEIMRTNYLGSLYCTHYALAYLKQTKGLIVGISSLTGKTGVPTRSAYSASKHAMAGFFDSLRIELAPYGVAVTMIYPGFVRSEVRQHALGPDGKPLGKSPVRENQVMPVETCARLIVHAMERRQREEVMTLRGKLGQWLKLIAPGLVDRIALNAIQSGR
jgi:short-subunit dehydrogenase